MIWDIQGTDNTTKNATSKYFQLKDDFLAEKVV